MAILAKPVSKPVGASFTGYARYAYTRLARACRRLRYTQANDAADGKTWRIHMERQHRKRGSQSNLLILL